MPVRQVVKPTKTTVRYIVQSIKNAMGIECESGLERDLALVLEFSPLVAFYEEQPQKFQIPAEPKAFTTIPDMRVTLINGEERLLEAKYARSAKKLEVRHQQVEKHLKTLGYRYQVLTERHIRPNQIVIDNCLYLNGFRSRSKRSAEELSIYVPKGTFRLEELIEILGDSQLAMELIARQLIYHDFTKILSQKSELRACRLGDFDFLTPFFI